MFQKIAIGGYLAYGLLAGLFIVGETLDDPGGSQAVWLIASWLIPLVIGVVFAWRNPASTKFVFLGLTVLVVVVSFSQIFAKTQWRNWESDNGPILGIATLVVCICLAVWARKNANAAGLLMLVCGLAPIVAEVIEMRMLRFGGSTAALSLPAVMAGLALLTVREVDSPKV